MQRTRRAPSGIESAKRVKPGAALRTTTGPCCMPLVHVLSARAQGLARVLSARAMPGHARRAVFRLKPDRLSTGS
eukprot:14377015-Alexandrium_andersonii.AAC.1